MVRSCKIRLILRKIKHTTAIKHKKILESVHALTKKRSNEYVTIHVYDREVIWNESVSGIKSCFDGVIFQDLVYEECFSIRLRCLHLYFLPQFS